MIDVLFQRGSSCESARCYKTDLQDLVELGGIGRAGARAVDLLTASQAVKSIMTLHRFVGVLREHWDSSSSALTPGTYRYSQDLVGCGRGTRRLIQRRNRAPKQIADVVNDQVG